MHSENIRQYSLQELIDDLNYATLIEDRWRLAFIDSEGVKRIMGNGYARAKDGIWVGHVDRDTGEVPRIRAELETAKRILSVSGNKMIQRFVAIEK